jgi:predicted TIM-barrel fold metal-dependent hydrolase
MEVNRLLSDHYFHPMYEEASRLNLAIATHVGVTTRVIGELVPKGGIMLLVTPNVVAFHALRSSDAATRFPRLRFGFLESGSQWLPFALQEGHRATSRLPGYGDGDESSNQFFVACQIDDELPFVMGRFPHSGLVIGTDYGHADIGFDMGGHRMLLERTDVDRSILEGIVSSNARKLYGL